MVRMTCECGRMLHGDECCFRNDLYDFEAWICPYCERVWFFPIKEVELPEEVRKADPNAPKSVKVSAFLADPMNEQAKAEMRKRLEKVGELISAIRRYFEQKGE